MCMYLCVCACMGALTFLCFAIEAACMSETSEHTQTLPVFYRIAQYAYANEQYANEQYANNHYFRDICI